MAAGVTWISKQRTTIQFQEDFMDIFTKPSCKSIQKNPLNRQPTNKDSDINNAVLSDGDYNCTHRFQLQKK